MPKLTLADIPPRPGADCPAPFDAPCSARARQRLADAGGLTQFGVNLAQLPPGAWSGQRHWHTQEDEFVFIVSGELVLVTDDGEQTMRAGDCAAFPANTPNGHHLVNRSAALAVILEIGSKMPADRVTYSDIDMQFDAAAEAYFHKDGTPYPAR